MDRLSLRNQPTQVIYGGREDGIVLTASWITPLKSVATSCSNGSIMIYRMNYCSSSSYYQDGVVKPKERKENGLLFNGMFDESPEIPYDNE